MGSHPRIPSKSRSGRIRIGKKKKVAFVCSGGAAKAGAFHLGVALALREQGFKFMGGLKAGKDDLAQPMPLEISNYVGSSAGSIICSYLAAGYSLENIFNSFLSRPPRHPNEAIPKILPRMTYSHMFKLRAGLAKEQIRQFLMIREIISHLVKGEWEALVEAKWLKTTGLFSTEGIEQYLREEVLPSNSFEDYRADLFVVATQLNHSRKAVFGKYKFDPVLQDPTCKFFNHVDISHACAASVALPFIFAPYVIPNEAGKDFYYIDGEIRDTLSTHVPVDFGADLVIASYTHQPYHYVKKVGSLSDLGLPAILVQSIYLVVEQKINKHIHNKELQRNAIDGVMAYCKQQGLNEEHRRRILEILETELQHRREVDTIYIHPRPTDYRMFTGEHFSLSPRKMSEYVKSGFKAAIEVLREYDFEDRDGTTPQILTSHAV